MEWCAKGGTGPPSASNSSSCRAVLVRWSSPRITWVIPMSTVVDDRGEVVAGHAVGAHDDEVAEGVRADHDRPADQVVDDDVPRRHLEAQAAGSPASAARTSSGRQARGSAGRSAACVPRPAPRAQLARGAPRSRSSGRRVPPRAVSSAAARCRRAARSAGTGRRPADVRTLVPLEPQPAQVGEDGRLVRLVRARRVGVVDAQDEAAAVVAGEEPVEERGARRADVQACPSGSARSVLSPSGRGLW